jgi:uncharacterized membrane-anchored protein YhcB (DUF1043 family)
MSALLGSIITMLAAAIIRRLEKRWDKKQAQKEIELNRQQTDSIQKN